MLGYIYGYLEVEQKRSWWNFNSAAEARETIVMLCSFLELGCKGAIRQILPMHHQWVRAHTPSVASSNQQQTCMGTYMDT
jgi:hypothetical protein